MRTPNSSAKTCQRLLTLAPFAGLKAPAAQMRMDAMVGRAITAAYRAVDVLFGCICCNSRTAFAVVIAY
jgi:hypothetical protein